jgi:hypothetical protein
VKLSLRTRSSLASKLVGIPFIVICHYFLLSESVGRKQRILDNQAARAAADTDADNDVPAEPPSKKTRGGHHQRIAQHRNEVASESSVSLGSGGPPKGPLHLNLIRRWSKGKLSAKDVRDISMDALRAGTPGMEQFAEMGASGAHTQNCFRAMQHILGYPAGAPTMDWFQIPTRAGPRTPHPFLLPHKFFSSYYKANTMAQWRKEFAGPIGASRQFWESIQDSPFIKHHPHMPKQLWPSTIPLGMHADGGPFSKQDSLFTINWNSLLGTGQTFRKRFVFTVITKSQMVEGTMDHLLKVFAWSMNSLLEGKTPEVDPFGRPIVGNSVPHAGSWRAALCQVRGDWEFYCDCFKFPRWHAHENMCFMCRASGLEDHLRYTNHRLDAPWRDTLWTDESYRAHLIANGQPIPALLMHAVGLRLDCIMPDVLHTIDLGVTAHIVGNVLFMFAVLRGVFGGANFSERVAKLSKDLDSWYKRTNCKDRLRGKITLETLRPKGDWPQMKGKAAALRHLADYIVDVVGRFRQDTVEDTLIHNICILLQRFYYIIASESQFLSPDILRELPMLGQKLAEFYSQLSAMHFDDVDRLWKISPKFHLMEHLMQFTAILYGNPRYFWTYADEDLVGHMVDIAETVHPSTLPFSVLFKWLHCYFVEDP